MSQLEEISVELTPEMASTVQVAIATGEFSGISEVVCEALRDWIRRRTLREGETEILRQLWQEGTASVPGQFASMEDIKAEARRRWLERKA